MGWIAFIEFVLILILVAVVIVMTLYIRNHLQPLLFKADVLSYLKRSLEELYLKVHEVKEISLYYNEPKVRRLLQHSEKVLEDIEYFNSIIELNDHDSLSEEEFERLIEQDYGKEEKEKHIFYAGP